MITAPADWLADHMRTRAFDVFLSGKFVHDYSNPSQQNGDRAYHVDPFDLYSLESDVKATLQWFLWEVNSRVDAVQVVANIQGAYAGEDYRVEGMIRPHLMQVLEAALDASPSGAIVMGMYPLVALFGDPANTRVYPSSAMPLWKKLRAELLRGILGCEPSLVIGGYYHGDLVLDHKPTANQHDSPTLQLAPPLSKPPHWGAEDHEPGGLIAVEAYKPLAVTLADGVVPVMWGSLSEAYAATSTLEHLFSLLLDEDPCVQLLHEMAVIGDWYV